MDRAAIQACRKAIKGQIKYGVLPGHGCDQASERNGMILAMNIVSGLDEDLEPPQTLQGDSLVAPIHLGRLIEICCSLAAESCPQVMRPTGSCTPLEDLLEWGLIERNPEQPKDYQAHGWRPTEKGRVHVNTLCSVALPTEQWVGARIR